MWARSNTVHGRPESVEAGIAYVRDEVMPVAQALDGFVGLSMLVDRSSGRGVTTTAWESREAMHASAERVRPLRERAVEVFGDTPQVAEWEVAVLHRMRPTSDGACTRVTWTRTDPANLDRMVDAFRLGLLPRIEDLPGFCSVSLLLDRETGRGASAVAYESRAALERTRRAASGIREEFTREMAADIVDVAEFDLVLAHLRVPETV